MTEPKQIYGEKTFLLTLLFGPMLATWGIAGNLRRMNQPASAVLVWIFGIVITVIHGYLSKNMTDGSFYLFIFLFTGNLIVSIISLGIYKNFQKPYFMMYRPDMTEYGFMHCIGAGIVAIIIYVITVYLLIFGFVMLAPDTVEKLMIQDQKKAQVHVSNCYSEFAKHTEESDADHVRNMMALQRCAEQDNSPDSIKLQACAKNALGQYQIDLDGKMGNRSVVDAEFIRCLSQ